MEHIHSNTDFTERKRGQHLSLDERGIIQALKKEGRSNHYIADRLNCSVTTIGYELRRDTPAYCGKGRRPEYSAKRGEAAVFTIVERLTGYYISIRIDGKNTAGVADAMEQLKTQYGEKFSQVFRSITTDNGSEFASFDEFEASGTSIYFAHPYTSCERPVNRNQRYSQKTTGLSHSG